MTTEPDRNLIYDLDGYQLGWVTYPTGEAGWELWSPHANLAGYWESWAQAEPDLRSSAIALGYDLDEALATGRLHGS